MLVATQVADQLKAEAAKAKMEREEREKTELEAARLHAEQIAADKQNARASMLQVLADKKKSAEEVVEQAKKMAEQRCVQTLV